MFLFFQLKADQFYEYFYCFFCFVVPFDMHNIFHFLCLVCIFLKPFISDINSDFLEFLKSFNKSEYKGQGIFFNIYMYVFSIIFYSPINLNRILMFFNGSIYNKKMQKNWVLKQLHVGENFIFIMVLFLFHNSV